MDRCSTPPPRAPLRACPGTQAPQGFLLTETTEVRGGGSLSPGGLPARKSLMGLLQGPIAGTEKKGPQVPWASKFGEAKAAEGPLLAGRPCEVTELPIAPGPRWKDFNRAPFFLRAGGGSSRSEQQRPVCTRWAAAAQGPASSSWPDCQLRAGGLTGISETAASLHPPAPKPKCFSSA